MPDFSQPVYASYVQLCRELRLKRPLHEMPKPFQAYQLFEGWDQLEAGGMVYSYGLAQDFHASVIHEDADPIWLPTLADWLEMLEEKEVFRVLFDAQYDVARNNETVWEAYAPTVNRSSAPPLWPTREEAAARLWVAVKKA